MKFNELTQADKVFFKKMYYDTSFSWDDRMSALIEFTSRSQRTIAKWAVKLGLKRKTEVDSPELTKAKERIASTSKKSFIITWAQNNTPVHERFLKNIFAYSKYIKADVHIIAGRYKNPTSVFSDKKYDVWHNSVIPYLDAARHDVHKYLSIMSDIKIQPTASRPMLGMEGLSGINSCVFGSPKVQLTTVPVLEGCKPKIMVTTGACTVKNYTDSGSGKRGEFHHTLGFVIVEIKDDDTFFVRQVTATDDGNFYDIYNRVIFNGIKENIVFNTALERLNWTTSNFGAEPVEWVGKTEIEKTKSIDACIFGDLHYGKEDSTVLQTTMEFLNKINPKHVVLHDVFDGESITHHSMKDPFEQYKKELNGTNSLKKEIDYMLTKLENFKHYENVVVVRSNHDDFLDRWLKNGDWQKQPTPKNSMEYMEYSQILLKQYGEDKIIGVIPELIKRKFPEYITLGRCDSYMVNGWELAQHGDVGSNGSRGGLEQFRKLNTKVILGHYHSPGRIDGALCVGTSTKLRVGYNIGPSGWLQSHVIIHNDGKAQHLNFIDGEFTILKN